MAAPTRRRRRLTPRTLREWGAAVPQWVGIFGLLVCLGDYLATTQANAAILTAFAGLIVVGQGAEAVAAIGQPQPDPPPGGTVAPLDSSAPRGPSEDTK